MVEEYLICYNKVNYFLNILEAQEIISQEIKKIRKNLGYTQQQIADLLGVDRSTYTCYETGRIKPDIKTIMSLSRVFGVDYTEILESENESRLSDSASSKENRNSKSSAKIKLANIRSLTKKEQDMVMLFRLLSGKTQDEVLKSFMQKFKNK